MVNSDGAANALKNAGLTKSVRLSPEAFAQQSAMKRKRRLVR
jgi:hypothetical protein